MRGGRHGAGDHHRAGLAIGSGSETRNVRRDIALKIGVIARQTRKAFDQRIEETGATRSQWTLLAVVSGKPGATQRTIAEILEMSEASVGRLIDRLCSEGLLERRAKEDDRRAHCIYISENAAPLLKQMAAVGAQTEAETFADLSDDELAQLDALLARIYANVTNKRANPLK